MEPLINALVRVLEATRCAASGGDSPEALVTPEPAAYPENHEGRPLAGTTFGMVLHQPQSALARGRLKQWKPR
jgi:hypothetical protein